MVLERKKSKVNSAWLRMIPLSLQHPTFELAIGCSATREFNGKVDESFVFSRALSADEIDIIAKKGIENAQAVSPKDKATTTWGKIKSWHQ